MTSCDLTKTRNGLHRPGENWGLRYICTKECHAYKKQLVKKKTQNTPPIFTYVISRLMLLSEIKKT